MRVIDMPEYQEYVIASGAYRREKSEYPKFTRLQLDQSSNPMERLRAFERKQENSRVCKAYYAAKKKYEIAYAQLKLKEKGIELNPLSELTLAEALEIHAPVTLEELRKNNKEENISERELAIREKMLEEYKATFTRSPAAKKHDPTFGDFDV